MTLFPNRFQFTSPSKLHDAGVFHARLRFYLCLFSPFSHSLTVSFPVPERCVGWLVVFIRFDIVLLESNRIAAWKRYICYVCFYFFSFKTPAALENCINIFLSVHLPQSSEIRVIFFSTFHFSPPVSTE